jgi:large subunit ribosomal protein L25
MKKYQLTVTTREGTGRSASRRLRKAEKIPAILYGKHTKPESLAISAPEFVKLRKEIAGQAAIIELKREAGPTAISFLQEIQRDAITDKYLHLDLHEVKADEKFEIRVPVRIVGEAAGVKVGGGILETSSFQLRIRCLPKDLPSLIEVDVTAVELGQTVHVSDMKPLPGVEFLDQGNQPVVSCVEPPAEEVAATPEAAAAPATVPPLRLRVPPPLRLPRATPRPPLRLPRLRRQGLQVPRLRAPSAAAPAKK